MVRTLVCTLLRSNRDDSTNLDNLVRYSLSVASTIPHKVFLHPQVLENHTDVIFPSFHDHTWLNSMTTLTTHPSLPHLQQEHVIRTWYATKITKSCYALPHGYNVGLTRTWSKIATPSLSCFTKFLFCACLASEFRFRSATVSFTSFSAITAGLGTLAPGRPLRVLAIHLKRSYAMIIMSVTLQ
jgi:hypothetical protein